MQTGRKKQCSKCGQEKFRSEFHKNKKTKDGLTHDCKSCVIKRSRQYYKDHKEEIRKRYLQYCKDHPEVIRERSRKYRKDHREEICESNRQYNKDHREENRERHRQYYKDHREEIFKLKPWYIKSLIRKKYKIPNELISDELIEDYRNITILERKTNERRKEELRTAVKGGTVRPNRKCRS